MKKLFKTFSFYNTELQKKFNFGLENFVKFTEK